MKNKDHIPFKEKLSYGIAGPVDILAVWVFVAIAYNVFNMELLLSPTQVAIILMALRLWDGLADPVMGWISDNTRSRWGRRKPYIVVGAILAAFTYPLIWWFPSDLNQIEIMLWVIGFGILFYTCFTVWCIPYQSLLMEMSPDYDERTKVASVRSVFQSFSGLFVGACWKLSILPIFFVDGVESPINGMRWISLLIAGIILILGPLPGIFVKERYYDKVLKSNNTKSNILDNIKGVCSCRPFMILCLYIFLFLMAQSVYDSFERYVGTYYIFNGDWGIAADFTLIGTIIFVVTNLAFIYFFRYFSIKTSKNACLLLGTFMVCVMPLISWFIFTPDNPWLQFLATILKGAGYAGIWLMVPSIQADAVDYDELKNGVRREGAFASIFSWILKFSFCLGLLLSGPLIEMTGFDASYGSNQSQEVLVNLRYGLLFLPALLFVMSLLSIRNFKLTREKLSEIRLELETKRGSINTS